MTGADGTATDGNARGRVAGGEDVERVLARRQRRNLYRARAVERDAALERDRAAAPNASAIRPPSGMPLRPSSRGSRDRRRIEREVEAERDRSDRRGQRLQLVPVLARGDLVRARVEAGERVRAGRVGDVRWTDCAVDSEPVSACTDAPSSGAPLRSRSRLPKRWSRASRCRRSCHPRRRASCDTAVAAGNDDVVAAVRHVVDRVVPRSVGHRRVAPARSVGRIRGARRRELRHRFSRARDVARKPRAAVEPLDARRDCGRRPDLDRLRHRAHAGIGVEAVRRRTPKAGSRSA